MKREVPDQKKINEEGSTGRGNNPARIQKTLELKLRL